MCGLTGIVNLSKSVSTASLEKATSIIKHRGPDDEGFLLWKSGDAPLIYAGSDTASSSRQLHNIESLPSGNDWLVGLGHRRLSIVDLSPAGHQPMLHPESGISLVFNGEVYNHKEIREELELLGYQFKSHSDTEVILKAWVEWGEASLHKFNGMFAILLLDTRNGGHLYAFRDRFGVKPLYWTKTKDYFGFASEIKQLRILPGYNFKLNKNIAFDYLAYGQVDHTSQTFDADIFQLRGGQLMCVDLQTYEHRIKDWYTLPLGKWKGTDQEAIHKFEELLTDSVKLRLRADVPVGSCLSGGLDSSAIVCLMEKVLKDGQHQGIKTVTASYEDAKYDEWKFAKAVVDQTGAQPHRIYPSFSQLKEDLEKLLWHMDEPFGSTSQFSQWCVFKGAAEVNLKVMLDGQGADEQLAGYGGNDVPMYTGLLKKFHFGQLYSEVKSYKAENSAYPKSQLLGAFRRAYAFIDKLLPSRLVKEPAANYPQWIKATYKKPALPLPSSLQETLMQQTLYTSLPVLLRYEDRNSMAWSIESRVPFMDYRFVEFTMSLPEDLVYRKRVRKYILREAMRGTFPEVIYQRRDKMGFVTPEEVWLKGEGSEWLMESVSQSAKLMSDIIDVKQARAAVESLLQGKTTFDYAFWRLACMGHWFNQIEKQSVSV